MEPKTVVDAEDQKKINEFARLFDRDQQLKSELKSLNDAVLSLKDAESELMMVDEEKVFIRYGNIFIATKSDDVTGLIENRQKESEDKQDAAKREQSRIQDQMDVLRKDLYATFGDNISLEMD